MTTQSIRQSLATSQRRIVPALFLLGPRPVGFAGSPAVPPPPPAGAAAGPPVAEFTGHPDGRLALGEISECASFFPERPEGSAMQWPPGRLGEVAKYLYCNAHSPVPEYAIATAIAFFAGICGRGWIVGRTGLNHDIVILGPSGSGKNIVESGTFNIARQLAGAPIAAFIFKGQMASAQGLLKRLVTHSCFVQLIGEVGKWYKAYSRCKPGDNIDQLFTEKLRLWESSGPDGASSGLIYSDSDKNVEGGVIAGVAHSTLGDSTPRAFYDSLKIEMWEQGFISRLWIIEYAGRHPEPNKRPLHELPKPVLDYLSNLVQEATKRSIGRQQAIELAPDAAEELRLFSETCREEIEDADGNETRLQLWVRAREKVLRLAGLCAVADNYIHPIIEVKHLSWAETMLLKTNQNIAVRLGDGSIGGDSDHAREKMVRDRCIRWLTSTRTNPKDESLRKQGIITRRFLQQEVSSLAAFRDHKFDAVTVLNLTLKSLVDQGYLSEVKKGEAKVDGQAVLGQCFRIIDNPRS